ncbi:MAG: adenylate kinase [Planctomycetota bacterium]|nr:MAG: adenylate kinase [Planctomycetota bacterium]HIC22958.1 adenylate kinase [Planctomycetota bacterium]
MRLVFLGPPGVGKGTQAAGLSSDLSIPHISTGALLREALDKGTPTGLEAKSFMEAGELVPDTVVLRLVQERISRPDSSAGWLLDGYPRNLVQAAALCELLTEMQQSLDRVVYFECSEAEVLRRLGGRRACRNCGETFHIEFAPATGACSAGSGEACDLYQRSDDSEQAILNRLEVYRRETDPLVDHYREQSALVVVDGSASIEAVSVSLRKALGQTP